MSRKLKLRSATKSQMAPKLKVLPLTLASSSKIQALDGLRAISITLVIMLHTVDSGSVGPGKFANFAAYGDFGVYIFFVLSGFLISRSIFLEEKQWGTFSLSHFYIRRIFRILPAAFSYLLFIAIVSRVYPINLRLQQWLPALLFFKNIVPGTVVLDHYWSLSVEEQFYLVFPLLLYFIRNQSARLILLSSLVLAWPFWYYFVTKDQYVGWTFWRTDIAIGWILMGCLLSGLTQSPFWSRILTKLQLHSDISFIIVVSLLISSFWTAKYLTWVVFVRACLVAAIIYYLVSNPNRGASRLLSIKALTLLGQWSYSLYIWQQFFIRENQGYWFQRLPINIFISLGCAIVSYYAIEKPVLAFYKNRVRKI